MNVPRVAESYSILIECYLIAPNNTRLGEWRMRQNPRVVKNTNMGLQRKE